VLVDRLYAERYRARDKAPPTWRDGLRFRLDPAKADDIPVWLIGSTRTSQRSGPWTGSGRAIAATVATPTGTGRCAIATAGPTMLWS
jgi:hypothetical protein